MISHGFISGALFLCVGVLYDQMHSREIDSYGGVANTMPVFSVFLVFLCDVECRPTRHFRVRWRISSNPGQLPGQWLVRGCCGSHACSRCSLYTLDDQKSRLWRDYQRKSKSIGRCQWPREKVVLGVLAVCVLGLGIYPMPLLEVMHSTVENLLQHAAISKL